MSVKTSFNNFFGLFNSCCAHGNSTKQETFDEDLEGNTFTLVLSLVSVFFDFTISLSFYTFYTFPILIPSHLFLEQNFKEKLQDYLDVIVLLEVPLFSGSSTPFSLTSIYTFSYTFSYLFTHIYKMCYIGRDKVILYFTCKL